MNVAVAASGPMPARGRVGAAEQAKPLITSRELMTAHHSADSHAVEQHRHCGSAARQSVRPSQLRPRISNWDRMPRCTVHCGGTLPRG
jgi:hypothetical protein